MQFIIHCTLRLGVAHSPYAIKYLCPLSQSIEGEMKAFSEVSSNSMCACMDYSHRILIHNVCLILEKNWDSLCLVVETDKAWFCPVGCVSINLFVSFPP